ncbi:MAG: hypothetical protein R2694_10270 [Ilumatobacteraceae bacterium]
MLARDPSVPVDRPQVVSRVGGCRLRGGIREVVADQRQLLCADPTHLVGPRRAAVPTLVDGPHLAGSHHLQQAGLQQDLHVVGHRALRALHGSRQFRHGGRPLHQQVEDRAAQRVEAGANLLGRGDDLEVGQLVVGSVLGFVHEQ